MELEDFLKNPHVIQQLNAVEIKELSSKLGASASFINDKDKKESFIKGLKNLAFQLVVFQLNDATIELSTQVTTAQNIIGLIDRIELIKYFNHVEFDEDINLVKKYIINFINVNFHQTKHLITPSLMLYAAKTQLGNDQLLNWLTLPDFQDESILWRVLSALSERYPTDYLLEKVAYIKEHDIKKNIYRYFLVCKAGESISAKYKALLSEPFIPNAINEFVDIVYERIRNNRIENPEEIQLLSKNISTKTLITRLLTKTGKESLNIMSYWLNALLHENNKIISIMSELINNLKDSNKILLNHLILHNWISLFENKKYNIVEKIILKTLINDYFFENIDLFKKISQPRSNLFLHTLLILFSTTEEKTYIAAKFSNIIANTSDIHIKIKLAASIFSYPKNNEILIESANILEPNTLQAVFDSLEIISAKQLISELEKIKILNPHICNKIITALRNSKAWDKLNQSDINQIINLRSQTTVATEILLEDIQAINNHPEKIKHNLIEQALQTSHHVIHFKEILVPNPQTIQNKSLQRIIIDETKKWAKINTDDTIIKTSKQFKSASPEKNNFFSILQQPEINSSLNFSQKAAVFFHGIANKIATWWHSFFSKTGKISDESVTKSKVSSMRKIKQAENIIPNKKAFDPETIFVKSIEHEKELNTESEQVRIAKAFAEAEAATAKFKHGEHLSRHDSRLIIYCINLENKPNTSYSASFNNFLKVATKETSNNLRLELAKLPLELSDKHLTTHLQRIKILCEITKKARLEKLENTVSLIELDQLVKKYILQFLKHIKNLDASKFEYYKPATIAILHTLLEVSPNRAVKILLSELIPNPELSIEVYIDEVVSNKTKLIEEMLSSKVSNSPTKQPATWKKVLNMNPIHSTLFHPPVAQIDSTLEQQPVFNLQPQL